MSPRRGLTIRLRLTLLLGALFIAAGSILLGMTYLLVRHSVTSNPGQVRAALAHRLGVDAAERLRPTPVPGTAPTSREAQARRSAFRQVQRDITNENLHRLLVESGIALGVMTVASIGRSVTLVWPSSRTRSWALRSISSERSMPVMRLHFG